MFGESLLITKTEQRRPAKWVTFAASLFFHSFFIAALIITPLVDADAGMPSLTIEHIFLSAPPPPAIPPPPTGGEGSAGKEGRHTKAPEAPSPTQVIASNRPVAPILVPDKIAEEQLTFTSDLPGENAGIIGAATGWNDGEEIPGMKQVLGTTQVNVDQPQVFKTFNFKAPKLIRRVAPDYPPTALRARIQGTVIIEADTDVYGKVTRTQVVNGHPLLVDAALDAVRQWLYEPYIINGIPRPVNFFVEVKFTLTR